MEEEEDEVDFCEDESSGSESEESSKSEEDESTEINDEELIKKFGNLGFNTVSNEVSIL